jgi:type II secretory pathway component HofQ
MYSRNRHSIWFAMTALVLLSLSVIAIAQEKDPGEPIKNLQFQAADIQSVLTILADYGGVNVVVAPEVTGTVTIKLDNIGWRQAMDIIGRTYGLAVVDEESGYIRVLQEEKYRKEVTEQQKHLAEKRGLAELNTRIVKISNSTSDDIVEAVTSLLSERGKATSDSRSNSIILQEIPSNIEKVVSYINELDRPAQQIKISTQILEISTDGLEELGLQWVVDGTNTSDNPTQKFEVLANRATDPFGRYTMNALQDGWTIDAIVGAVQKSGKGKIVAHPEITTVDNKEARIQMGQKVPIKQFDESGNVVTKFEEVGTILKVTPHITAENQIIMHLLPERSTYQFDPNGVIINTSNAETNVIVGNGQTAVIGGLTTADEVETITGVPVLKDIPVLGFLFRYSNKRTENRDLVIFVTPTIIESGLAMSGK